MDGKQPCAAFFFAKGALKLNMAKKLSPVLLLLGGLLFFIVDCYCVSTFLKRMSLVLLAGTFSAVFLAYSRLREQMRPPLVMLGLLVAMDAVSCFYTTSGRFAVYEVLRVLAAFCIALILLSALSGRQIAVIVTGGVTVSSVISIDMMATRLLSGPVLEVLGRISGDYRDLPGVEPGIRMTSMFMNPNIFAGMAGIAVLLGLGLVMESENRKIRTVHLICLFINSLAFLLAFSMGAILAIAVAFPAYLLFEYKGHRVRLLVLMAETLLVTLLMVFPISQTSFSAWDGVRVVPVVCLVLGAALLCGLDFFAGHRLADALEGHGKVIAAAVGVCLGAALLFFILAMRWTGGITLEPGEPLRRSVYPGPGSYQLFAQADGAAQLVVESQNLEDTMMHSSTILYEGEMEGALFTVPEDSIVVHFNFTAPGTVHLEHAEYTDGLVSSALPLRYRLLPSFIANRLQAFRANQNAIQRFVFFEDGLKMFAESPIIGLGMGAYEDNLQRVQSFYYGTRYAHNQFIQSLVDTGIIGCLIFTALLVTLAAAVWFGRKNGVRFAPALGGGLVFLIGHVMTEMVFSIYSYLPVAFGMFAVINDCCAEQMPAPKQLRENKGKFLMGCTAFLFACGLVLVGNVASYRIAEGGTLENYAEAVRLDLLSWENHMVNYLDYTLEHEVDEEVREQADRYALRLEKKGTSDAPYSLTEYYLETGRMEKAMETARQYASGKIASNVSWRRLLELLERYEEDTPLFREGVLELARMREEWNAGHIGTITLTEENEAFLARVRGAAA